MSIVDKILDLQALGVEVYQHLDKSDYNKEFTSYIARLIYEKSQSLVPVDTGYLKKSGKIVNTGNNRFEIKYTAPYASFVHEIIGLSHKYPTQSKYLEDAAYSVASEIFFEMNLSTIPFKFHMETSNVDGITLIIDEIDNDVVSYYKTVIENTMKESYKGSLKTYGVVDETEDEQEIGNKILKKGLSDNKE